MIHRQGLKVLVLGLSAGSGAAFAAPALVPPDLITLPWVQFGLSIFVAFVGSVASITTKAVDAITDKKEFALRPQLVRGFALSVMLGVLSYVFGARLGAGQLEVAAMLLAGGWAGDAWLKTLTDRFLGAKT